MFINHCYILAVYTLKECIVILYEDKLETLPKVHGNHIISFVWSLTVPEPRIHMA